jgi:hypothetical protein
MIQTDIAIVGAGPVGLFAVFEAGLLKMRCHLIDYLPQVGGQLSEIYPKKPIYDIPGYPSILAQELVDNLMKQIEPFHPTFTLGERIEEFEKRDERDFVLTTNMGTQIYAKAVVIAGGLGCFEPGESLTQAVKEGWQTLAARLERRRVLPPSNLLRLRALDPRRQVYFFYQAMVRRGGEEGVPRKPSQSPSEYAAQLEKALPSEEEDIEALTRAFVEARYSLLDVDTTKASRVKEIWGRIRRALQGKSKSDRSGN